jgi:uncharacterized protein YoaH (UPF0181 family)
MLDWPWEKSERALRTQIEECKCQIADFQDSTRDEMSSLSNMLLNTTEAVQSSVEKRHELMSKRVATIESNIKILHKAVLDTHNASGKVVEILKGRMDRLEEKSLESDFFIQLDQQTIGLRLRNTFRRFFSRYHLLVITNILFMITAAALSYLLYLNL